MPFVLRAVASAAVLALAAGSIAQAAVSSADKAFVGKVSQGGMFESLAGRLAEDKASAQDVKDFGATEVHDHNLVNGKLKSIAATKGLPIAATLNPELQGKFDKLKGMNGSAFDAGYMMQMAAIHKKDGGLFAIEAKTGSDPELKAFAAETVKIVNRHIGAIHGASPQ